MAERAKRRASPPLGIGKHYETTIESLVYGGEGLARLQGKVVFIPFVLPQEKVKIEIVEEKRDFARGRLVTILSENPARQAPRCRHFADCGGCHLQHLAYPEQLQWKETWAKENLSRLQETPIEWLPSAGAEPPWEYRERVQVHRNGDGKWGFHRSRSHEVVEIVECPITHPEVMRGMSAQVARAAPGVERLEITYFPAERFIERQFEDLILRTPRERVFTDSSVAE